MCEHEGVNMCEYGGVNMCVEEGLICLSTEVINIWAVERLIYI